MNIRIPRVSCLELLSIAATILAIFLSIAGLVYGEPDIPGWYNPEGDNWVKMVKIVKIKDQNMFISVSEIVQSENSNRVEIVEVRLFIPNESFLKDHPAGVPLFIFIDTDGNGKIDMVIAVPRLGTSPRREKLDKDIDMSADAVIKWMDTDAENSKIRWNWRGTYENMDGSV